ncbi:N-acetyl sugar amidotransferase [Paraneptunicella aestuarii]|uniref:N-acetyl sugar amidotransferase n=1 Tax=Paraneptunicella aestuarii TaxID=2831148 RepID=UPI001E2EEDEC|nr:N-acetyl sugar amidotransferase [Paraneptunicella aestuarii]UAA39139.1 N-acetyl sugar amidotransferase [Paraneptunicella aestuarii]
MTIKAPSQVDYSKFEPEAEITETKYGLPLEVKYCKRCVISNQRPNSALEYKHNKDSKKKTINFTEEGICEACVQAERKKKIINWEERDQQLRELCNRYRKHDGSYDCLVPGSGGKDSFYAAYKLKYEYGMNPLTVTWAPHIYTDWGYKNFHAWINAGFDNQLVTPNGRIHRLLTRLAVDVLFHPFQPFMLGQKFLAPKLAAQLNIPLVFFGENEAEYGNPIADNDSALRDKRYFTTEDRNKVMIGGVSVQELEEEFGVTKNELSPYMPADPQIIHDAAVEVHYLGYYLKWHPQSCYYYAVEHGGFQASPERTTGTYSKYNSIDDKIDDFHYHTSGVKFGIGRATYDAAQEIRSGDITREEGVALVHRYDHEYPERFADEVFDYLSIKESELPAAYKQFEEPTFTREYYEKLADSYRSPHLWMKENGVWKLRHTVK